MFKRYIFRVLFALTFLISNAIASTQFLPRAPVFPRNYSDPISRNSGLEYNFSRKEITARLGGTFGVLEFAWDNRNTLQFSFGGSAIIVFDFDPNNFPIQTLDFQFSFPIDFLFLDNFLIRTEFVHISSHLSDEVKNLKNAGYARDSVKLTYGYEKYFTKSRVYGIFYYGTIGSYINMHPKGEPILLAQGFEFRMLNEKASPYLGINLKLEQDSGFIPNTGFQFGLIIKDVLYVVIDTYFGKSFIGQNYKRWDNNINFKLLI